MTPSRSPLGDNCCNETPPTSRRCRTPDCLGLVKDGRPLDANKDHALLAIIAADPHRAKTRRDAAPRPKTTFMIRHAPLGGPPTAPPASTSRRLNLYSLVVHHPLGAVPLNPTDPPADDTIILPEKTLRDNHLYLVTHANDFAPEHLSFQG